VEGPKGPHLFRSSTDSSLSSQEDRYHLSMSPLTPKISSRPDTAFKAPPIPDVPPPVPPYHRPISTLTEAVDRLDGPEVRLWTPRQVARWMYDAGFEPSIVEKFEENDISGAILITLKFEDLRELDIQSLGKRLKLWNEIHNLRGSAPSTPMPPTPIDERPSSIDRKQSRRGRSQDCASDEENNQPRRRRGSRRKHKKPTHEDIISPLESVSIVGIEQLVPKAHNCSKGENCSKWRKQQRLIAAFRKEHPVSPEGGTILIAGDPGNPLTAEATRPFSNTVPSVVASSDVMGPGALLRVRSPLDEDSLKTIQARDPQDNVKQFLSFQHLAFQNEQPPTPPYEMFPTLPALPPTPAHPHQGLSRLPKLAIPTVPPPRAASAQPFSPYRMDRAEAKSPELRNATRSPTSVYRFGTPFSDMDIPHTAVPVQAPSRDASQSVPPNMSYHHSVGQTPSVQGPPPSLSRSTSKRTSHRPSFPAMPRLDENKSLNTSLWSPIEGPQVRGKDDIAHAGWMKKRKTKLLRNEWHDHHFTLRGTSLSMTAHPTSPTILESIDIDDYAIACSSLSSSKLNAAFKAMNISRGKKDEAAFAFQLIPAAIEKGKKLRKGDLGKTHHFAVRSRDERIDWMRELMLAKALRQKGEGFEVEVNGNMI
jgi:hypothetical protein